MRCGPARRLTDASSGFINGGAASMVTTSRMLPTCIMKSSPQDDSTALAGVDLVTVGPTLAVRGSGEADVVLSVDGKTSNTARINIR